MITKETCVKIWSAYNEIEKAEKLLLGIEKEIEKGNNEPTFENAFGDRNGLQLGVPCGPGGHSLYGVRTELGIKVIEAHIADKKQHLKELHEIARKELNAYDLSPMVNGCGAKSEKCFLCMANGMEVVSFYSVSKNNPSYFTMTKNVLDATTFDSIQAGLDEIKKLGVIGECFTIIEESKIIDGDD